MHLIETLKRLFKRKSKKKEVSIPPYDAAEPLFMGSTFEEAIFRELAENDITSEERTKDYLASQRRKKEEESQR